jgi:elongation factor Ts
MITSEHVKELRARTNCGIVDCKKALEESNGNVEEAVLWLRRKGKASAAKKAERQTKEGVVANYIHSNHKLGVLVALSCETDFVARNERFQELARSIAVHIAAMDPLVVRPEDIPDAVIESEKSIALEQASASGKPATIQEKIVAGKLKSFRAERALLTQPFVKDPSKTVADLINEAISELGENISVSSFSRLTI